MASIELSARGMRNLAPANLEKDFAFVVGGHEYRCSRF